MRVTCHEESRPTQSLCSEEQVLPSPTLAPTVGLTPLHLAGGWLWAQQDYVKARPRQELPQSHDLGVVTESHPTWGRLLPCPGHSPPQSSDLCVFFSCVSGFVLSLHRLIYSHNYPEAGTRTVFLISQMGKLRKRMVKKLLKLLS